MTRTSHPCGCPLFSKQVQPPATLLSEIWSPSSDLRAPVRLTRSAPRSLGVAGELVSRPGIEPGSLRLKGVTLAI